MGLGKSDAYLWKRIITSWFPSVQVDTDAVRGNVTVVIQDMCLKFYNIQSSSYTLRKLLADVKHHPGKIFAKFPSCARYVCLVDDPNDVPESKRPTQASRDKDCFTPEELQRLGRMAYFSQLDEGDTKWIDRDYRRESEAFNASQRNKGRTRTMNPFQMFMAKLMNTRCGNRKLDVYHAMGREMLNIKKETFSLFGLERTMILDGCALPRDDSCRRLVDDSCDIVMDEFDSYVPGKKYPTDNVILTSDRTVRGSVRYALGESDVKIVSWLLAEVERAGRDNPQDVWICCCDTDLIPILLASMHKLIDPVTGNIPHNVYLDLTFKTTIKVDVKTLSDVEREFLRKNPDIVSAWSLSTQVWDMVELWRLIHSTFGECFPGIKRPVEVFCTLLVLGATDFVTRLVDVGIAPLWEAFRAGGYSLLSDGITTVDFSLPDSGQKAFDPVSGLPLALDPPRDVLFDEEALYRFVRYLYMVKLSCTHKVDGRLLGFDPPTSAMLRNELVARIADMKGRETPLKKAIEAVESSRSTLIIEGGDPTLSVEEAEEQGENYCRTEDLDKRYDENKKGVEESRTARREASSHGKIRPYLVKQRAFSLTPRIKRIHDGYAEVGLRKKSIRDKIIPGEAELRGYVRRAAWNLDYWFRGWHPDWQDRSIEMTPEDESISGWAPTQGGGVDRTNTIYSPRPKRG